MHPVSEQDRELLRQVEDRPAVLVENKCDLRSSQFLTPDSRLAKVETSALTGEGVPELRAAILRHVGGEIGPQIETGFLTNVRHEKLVRDSIGALGAASDAVSARIPHEMLLLDLYGALRPLDEITGATTTDDILNLIFSTFCIGK
jgi:tRNA modification GTPase